MINIGITQRVDKIKGINEIRDSLDQNWYNIFSNLGINLFPIPNKGINLEHFIKGLQLKGFIFSGGNDLSHLANAKNISIEGMALKNLF